MKVGVTSWFCNTAEWETRVQSGDLSQPYPITDAEQYDRELYLAGLVEPLGFDSFWTIEHHFSPYGMTGTRSSCWPTWRAAHPGSSWARWCWCCPGMIR